VFSGDSGKKLIGDASASLALRAYLTSSLAGRGRNHGARRRNASCSTTAGAGSTWHEKGGPTGINMGRLQQLVGIGAAKTREASSHIARRIIASSHPIPASKLLH
jgi:hypothetical protein